jgi:hypothetical protein
MISLAHVTSGGITKLRGTATDKASLSVDVEFTVIADVYPSPWVPCEAQYGEQPQNLTADYPLRKQKAVFDAFRNASPSPGYSDLREATCLVEWSDSEGCWELVFPTDRRVTKRLSDYDIRTLVDDYYERLSMAE